MKRKIKNNFQSSVNEIEVIKNLYPLLIEYDFWIPLGEPELAKGREAKLQAYLELMFQSKLISESSLYSIETWNQIAHLVERNEMLLGQLFSLKLFIILGAIKKNFFGMNIDLLPILNIYHA